MDNKKNFDRQQAVNMNKDIFLEHFAQANGLSKAKRQPINLMGKEHRTGIYSSSAACSEWLNRTNDMKREITILKTKKQEELTIETKDLIGNTLIKKITNLKDSTWRPVLRQRWVDKPKGSKEYSRSSLKDNYLTLEMGDYFDGLIFGPDSFIIVDGKRIYLSYENFIPGLYRIVLMDTRALEPSKKYNFNDKYQGFDSERDKYHVAKFKSFDEMRKIAKKQYSTNDGLPTYSVKVVWEQDKTSETYGIWHYSVTTNVGLSEELDEELLKA